MTSPQDSPLVLKVATERIHSGQRITVDGDGGVVKVGGEA
jgi:hypothetical protein